MTNLVELDEHHLQIVASVKKITSDFGHAAFNKAARAGTNAPEYWKALSEAGFIGISVPEEYGGGGQGVEELALVLEASASEGCPMMALVVLSICVFVLAKHGSAKQKEDWLPGIASGTKRMAFAITEPDAGTNTHKLRTSARRDGDGWRLNGSKYYITGAASANAIMVVAKTGEDPKTGRGRLSLFIVPADAKGLTITNLPTELMAPDRQATLFFDDVYMPAEALVGEEGRGLANVFVGLNPERIVVSALCNGITAYALKKAADYARDRKIWDGPIGSHQAVAHPLAEAYAKLQLSRMATQRAARLYDEDKDAGEASNIAKLFAADTAVFALDRAIQTHGGNGFSQEYGLADLWFITRVQQTAPVSREMILNHIAQHSLGLPKSY